jgi:hypothetical protein
MTTYSSFSLFFSVSSSPISSPFSRLLLLLFLHDRFLALSACHFSLFSDPQKPKDNEKKWKKSLPPIATASVFQREKRETDESFPRPAPPPPHQPPTPITNGDLFLESAQLVCPLESFTSFFFWK